jgi:predicted alpha/beta superfamily hydrolase
MKKALVYVFAVFVVLMAGIGAWYANSLAGRADQVATAEKLAEATRRVPVTIEVETPASTPDDQVLYVAGSGPLGEWDAAGVALQPTDGGRHATTIELIQGVEYAFKVTRGTWSTVEVKADDQDIADRTIRAAEPKTVTVAVEAWRDKGQSIPGRITYTGDIRTHQSLPSDPLSEPRDLYIYLPPGYDQQPDRRYPVLYLQDGQNLFDESSSYAGIEWGVDETAQTLIESGQVEPMIVVGIANTPDRAIEYRPGSPEEAADATAADPQVPEAARGEAPSVARGDDYADLVAGSLKAFVDEHYRTRTGPQHTAIGGAGLGAIISLHTLHRHPETFGSAVALSPFAWGGNRNMLDELLNTPDAAADNTILTTSPELAEALSGHRVTLHVLSASQDRLNERDWAELVDDVLLRMYGQPDQTVAAD